MAALFRSCPRLDSVNLSIGRSSGHKVTQRYMHALIRPLGDLNPLTAGMDQLRALCLATKDASKVLKRLTASGVGYKLLGCNGADAELFKNSLKSLHRLRLRIELSSSDDQFLGDAETIQHPEDDIFCLLYTSPSPRDGLLSRMPSSA